MSTSTTGKLLKDATLDDRAELVLSINRCHEHFLDLQDAPAPEKSVNLRAGFVSDTGLRQANEDCGYANVREGLFLVADGVGGAYGGAVASHTIVDTVPASLLPILQSGEFGAEELQYCMRDAILIAQRAMTEAARRDPNLWQMASTIVLGVIVDGTLFLSHIGDSQAYLLRDGKLTQLTKDHSMVQALVDAGCLTKEQAKNHIYRHVITESVNAKRVSPIEVARHELLSGDRILFATDGLTDVMDEEAMAWILSNSATPQAAAEVLTKQALDCGTRDNVTCLVVQVD